MEARVRDLEARLNKRATFEAAVAELAAVLRGIAPDAAPPLSAVERTACVSACRRLLTLLNARYTDVTFWMAGREVFAAMRARLGDCDGLASSALQRCAEVLHEEEDEAGPSTAPAQPHRPRGVLFEGQLGLSGAAAPAAAASVALSPEVAALAALLGADATSLAGGAAATAEEDGVLIGLEEALAASLATPHPGHAGPPPAARAAVAALRAETLTAERLASLGAGLQCAVCREELREGDVVQLLPCSDAHCFHAPCLAPWLAAHNSCPVCRHELPTDDWRYEERKERAQQHAEDAKGAANALRGGEFMWL